MSYLKLKNLHIIILTIVSSSALCLAQGINVREERIKAACLYHITQYIDWPKEENIDSFNFCTFNTKTTYDYLLDTFEGKKRKDKDFNIIKIDALSRKIEIQSCNLIYIGENTFNLDKILNLDKTLVVSSNSDSFSKNTPIAIYKTDNKMAINIKLKILKDRGFNVSSQLLNIAVIK